MATMLSCIMKTVLPRSGKKFLISSLKAIRMHFKQRRTINLENLNFSWKRLPQIFPHQDKSLIWVPESHPATFCLIKPSNQVLNFLISGRFRELLITSSLCSFLVRLHSLKAAVSVHHGPKGITGDHASKAKKIKCLNAYTQLLEDLTLATSGLDSDGCSTDRRGFTIAVKENFCTKGYRTSCASRMLDNFKPAYNATVVQKLLDAGALMIGKTNMDEFGMGSGTVDSLYGPTKNAWRSGLKYSLKSKRTDTTDYQTGGVGDDWFIAGGSSGGSAVAVASGTCFGALGSDTGGSTRNPAAYCGVVGLKPTYGLLSRHGLIPLVNSMDVPGLIARTVEDAVVMLNIMAGPDRLDSTTIKERFKPVVLPENPSVKGLRVGIPKEYHCPGMSSEVVTTWTKVADLLADGGAELVEVSLPHTQYSIACYSILNPCEVASNFARYDGIEYGLRADENTSTEALYAASRSLGFNEVVRGRILAGNYFLLKSHYSEYFEKAMKVRRLIANDYVNVFSKEIDVLLTPVTLSDAPLYSEFRNRDHREQSAIQDYCTQPVNMAGIPAVSIPIELSSKSMPLSLQIIANHFQESKMLTVAKWIEERVDFPMLELEI